MTLKQVDFTITLANNGEFLSVEASISLEEYSEGKTSNLTQSKPKSASASKAGDVFAATVDKKRAMNATASSSDKARLSNYALN